MSTPTEELREASRKLRSLADRLDTGPWTTRWNGQDYELRTADPEDRTYPITQWTYAIATSGPNVGEQRAECDTGAADYIAAMHPFVGLALSDVLDAQAYMWGIGHGDHTYCQAEHCPQRAALSLARWINGGDQL